MKKIRKITALILATVMMLSVACVNANAAEEDSMLENIRIFQNSDGKYFVKGIYYPGVDYDSEVSLFEVSEGGEKILLKDFSESEVLSFEHMVPVALPELSEEKTYCFKVVNYYIMEDGSIVGKTEYYDFVCNDLKAEKPEFFHYELEFNENETFDLMDWVLFPVGYEGEVSFEALDWYEFYGETSIYFELDCIEIDGSIMTATNDGKAFVDLYTGDGEKCDSLHLEIFEAGPDSFGEKIYDAYEDLVDMAIDFMGNSVFLGIFGDFWLIILLMTPFVALFTLIFGV